MIMLDYQRVDLLYNQLKMEHGTFFWRVSKIDHDLRQGFSQQKMVVSKHLEWF